MAPSSASRVASMPGVGVVLLRVRVEALVFQLRLGVDRVQLADVDVAAALRSRSRPGRACASATRRERDRVVSRGRPIVTACPVIASRLTTEMLSGRRPGAVRAGVAAEQHDVVAAVRRAAADGRSRRCRRAAPRADPARPRRSPPCRSDRRARTANAGDPAARVRRAADQADQAQRVEGEHAPRAPRRRRAAAAAAVRLPACVAACRSLAAQTQDEATSSADPASSHSSSVAHDPTRPRRAVAGDAPAAEPRQQDVQADEPPAALGHRSVRRGGVRDAGAESRSGHSALVQRCVLLLDAAPRGRRRTARGRAASARVGGGEDRTASRPAFAAPPMETVATGTPAGICTIESSESRPSSVASGTGTPITGSVVTAASIPGRCAAPPAPAMMTRMPRPPRPRPEGDHPLGGAVRGDAPRPRAATPNSREQPPPPPASRTSRSRSPSRRPDGRRAPSMSTRHEVASVPGTRCRRGPRSALEERRRGPRPAHGVVEVAPVDGDVPDLAAGPRRLAVAVELAVGMRGERGRVAVRQRAAPPGRRGC